MSRNNRTQSEPVELIDVDKQILSVLEDGRCTPRLLSNEVSESQSYVSHRLRFLADRDLVDRVDRGLWELADGGDRHD